MTFGLLTYFSVELIIYKCMCYFSVELIVFKVYVLWLHFYFIILMR